MKGKQESSNHRSDRGREIEISAGYWSGKCLIELFHYAKFVSPSQNPKRVSENPLLASPKTTAPAQVQSHGADRGPPSHTPRPPPSRARPLSQAQDSGRLEAPFPEHPLPPDRNRRGGGPTPSRVPRALPLTLGNLSGSPGCLGITFCNL